MTTETIPRVARMKHGNFQCWAKAHDWLCFCESYMDHCRTELYLTPSGEIIRVTVRADDTITITK